MKMSEHSTQIREPGPLAASNPRGIKITGAYRSQPLMKSWQDTY